MNCAQAQEHLSPFYDGELPFELGEHVAEHCGGCEECSHALAEIRELSEFAVAAEFAEPPPGLWRSIEQRLHRSNTLAVGSKSPWSKAWKVLATAATLLAAFGLASFASRISTGRKDAASQIEGKDASRISTRHKNFARQIDGKDAQLANLAVNFQHYLEKYLHDPDEAQNVLLNEYRYEIVDYQQAEKVFGFRPASANDLTEEYSRHAVYLFDMPCCKCLQTIYKRKHGNQTLAIIEHATHQPIWFGDRPSVIVKCQSRATHLVEFDGLLAATWKSKKRYLTVVGAKDIEEVALLISHLNGTATQN